MLESASQSKWWKSFSEAIERTPEAEHPRRYADLALVLINRGDKKDAALLAAHAWRIAHKTGDDSAADDLRKLFLRLTPQYHTKISTNTRRIEAWNAALLARLKPGSSVLEVGTGSGILSLLAARAGAQVVSCEIDPIMAAVAEVIIENNNFNEKIKVVNKPVKDILIPEDLPMPADMLILDVFGNYYFRSEPFKIIKTARRNLRPDTQTLPRRVTLLACLADYDRWSDFAPGQVSDFDLSPLRDVTPNQIFVRPESKLLQVRSAAQPIIDVTLTGDLPGDQGDVTVKFNSDGGRVNGVVVWWRLELSPEHILEAKPGAVDDDFYTFPAFYAFQQSTDTKSGDAAIVTCSWRGPEFLVKRAYASPPKY